MIDSERQDKGIEDRYFDKYGDFMTLQDLARALKYPSAEAVKKAHARGKLPVTLFRIDGRRNLYGSTQSVVELIKQRCMVPHEAMPSSAHVASTES